MLPVVNKRVVSAAARLVAKNCAGKGKRFVLVLHGGGEPTIHWGLIKGIVSLSRVVAQEYGIPWFGYIATNGVMAESRALWLGRHFDVVGLSCDGPPEIQDRQRCLHNGGASSFFVERTAHMIKDAGGEVEVRSTITPETIERQAEIVSYIYRKLGASTIRLEPAYCGHNRSEHRFTGEDADRFATQFLEAQDLATSLGCTLSFSGVRPDEIHGPYCDVLRNVLRLTPDGAATACFFSTGSHDTTGRQLQIGGIDESTGEFALDMDRIDAFRQKASAIPGACRECINSYSCTRACPDSCSVLHHGWQNMPSNNNQRKESTEFRCLVHQKLTLAWLLKFARRLVDGAVPVGKNEGKSYIPPVKHKIKTP
jgi:radical SAM protein with 4Fe4S-binding SPASM domain